MHYGLDIGKDGCKQIYEIPILPANDLFSNFAGSKFLFFYAELDNKRSLKMYLNMFIFLY